MKIAGKLVEDAEQVSGKRKLLGVKHDQWSSGPISG